MPGIQPPSTARLVGRKVTRSASALGTDPAQSRSIQPTLACLRNSPHAFPRAAFSLFREKNVSAFRIDRCPDPLSGSCAAPPLGKPCALSPTPVPFRECDLRGQPQAQRRRRSLNISDVEPAPALGERRAEENNGGAKLRMTICRTTADLIRHEGVFSPNPPNPSMH